MVEERDYEIGDLVEIITTEEYRARGGTCTENCAIARFAGSVCEVVDINTNFHGFSLSPISIVENIPRDSRYLPIERYTWQYRSIKRYDGDLKTETENDFDEVFA